MNEIMEKNRLQSGDVVTIKCPKCGEETSFRMIVDAYDENAEVYMCQHCKWLFRFVEK